MMFENVPKIAEAKTRNLKELAKLAGADPTSFYIGADFRKVDISGQNLEGLDLTNAQFAGVIADSATVVDRRFRPKLFAEVLRSREVPDWRNLSREGLMDHAVIAARAGQMGFALEVVDELLRREPLPPHIASLVRCEELPEEARNHVYRIWAKTYRGNPAIATVWALIGYDRSIKNVIADLVKFVERFSDRDLAEYSIDDPVTTIIGVGSSSRASLGVIAHWLDYHANSQKLKEVYDFMFHFPSWAVRPISDGFSQFVRANLGDKSLGPLIARALPYFRKSGPNVDDQALEWLVRHPKAPSSKEVLLECLKGRGSGRKLAKAFNKWTYHNDWRASEDDHLFRQARLLLSRPDVTGRSSSTLRNRLAIELVRQDI